MLDFDVIVVGGGHAGTEAAAAVSRSGGRCALVTLRIDRIGRMSCNPAIGGIAKGQIAREVDALGGLMGRATDATGIQFRMLNVSKGPAVQSPRAQADKYAYEEWLQRAMLDDPNITVIEGEAVHLVTEEDAGTRGRGDAGREEEDAARARGREGATGEDAGTPGRRDAGTKEKEAVSFSRDTKGSASLVVGVALKDGRTLRAAAVVLTTGTFLNGLMHTGEAQTVGGRVGEPAATGLTASLVELGLTVGRLKTGTCPRLARETLDLDSLPVQPGDPDPQPFSFLTDDFKVDQLCCWITATNARVHDVIRANLHRAPMYSGQIHGRGPRYCPSIEDKIVRFADKSEHHIFLEPESRRTNEIYCNGIPTSLPIDVQDAMVHAIRGLENAKVLRWGYAVEYDFVPPTQLDATLAVRGVAGLFLAGQINGTSGYEEAAGQGIIAGINAARFAAGREMIVVGRDQAYIGVMIDDLVTKGTDEPYRMFTSRAEHRLVLRSDNADRRLTPLAASLGVAEPQRVRRLAEKELAIADLRARLTALRVGERTGLDVLRRPDVTLADLAGQYPALREQPFSASADVLRQVEIEVKYSGYIERSVRQIERFRKLEDRPIPPGLDFLAVPHLRNEARDKFSRIAPRSIGQAGRISGIVPSDIAVLLIHLERRRRD